MSTRSTGASSSSKRKRRSSSAAAAESPAKRCSTQGPGASVATVDDPPTLVPVAPPATCDWCTALRRQREAGQFIDITLLVGRCKIPAHKTVLVGLSPYIEGLLTSGLAESKEGGDELKIGDEDRNGRAVEAIVVVLRSGRMHGWF
jgi:hypothetical protein